MEVVVLARAIQAVVDISCLCSETLNYCGRCIVNDQGSRFFDSSFITNVQQRLDTDFEQCLPP